MFVPKEEEGTEEWGGDHTMSSFRVALLTEQ